jgi:hypothetical protein
MKNTSKNTRILLKAIELELKAILEIDIKKFSKAGYIKNKNAAFLQFIAA